MVKMNVRVSHPRVLRMLTELSVRLEMTDTGYKNGSLNIKNIIRANSELVALFQLLINELKESSTKEGIKQILKENVKGRS